MALVGRHALEPATVWSGTHDHVDLRMWQAERCHLPRNACEWVYDRLDTLFAEVAARLDIAVDPLFEDIQLVRYGAGAHFQIWHSDAGADRQAERLISASVELSDAGDYEGGVLEIVPALGLPRTLPRSPVPVAPAPPRHAGDPRGASRAGGMDRPARVTRPARRPAT
ncbi:2OG-Fe(II) oxygenase [Sphingomonas sp. MG17]|uniref:2OG-Fe(II) oxygenase n=1 Tax=Sphingomonas tagetis TaxID=2949092 RepID=A0A9X2HN90_9SPHN|nr:2OG-Fe(II) oxygenase [Sphingomonas tagetis]MCP3730789.1 2OG-Fe(II) oxygenase [Sphingomonas tagetis]